MYWNDKASRLVEPSTKRQNHRCDPQTHTHTHSKQQQTHTHTYMLSHTNALTHTQAHTHTCETVCTFLYIGAVTVTVPVMSKLCIGFQRETGRERVGKRLFC